MQQISLIVGSEHKLHHIQLNPFKLMVSGLLCLCFILCCFCMIWRHYQDQMIQLQLKLTAHNPVQTHRQIESLKDQAQQQLAVLAGRVGTIQAQIGRLNALGQRLIDQAHLEGSEFNFDDLPPMGGGVVSKHVEDVDLDALLILINQLEYELPHRQQQLKVLERVVANNNWRSDAFISGKPVPDVRGTWLSSHYGIRIDPFTKRPAMHRGIDFAGKDGMNILSTGAGIVVFAGKRIGYGLTVEVNHGNGLVTRYAHAAEIKVKPGDIVNKGDVIALMGSSGRSTGPHVHYEVLEFNRIVNPEKFVFRTAMN